MNCIIILDKNFMKGEYTMFEKGQGLIEYALIIVLIAVVVIIALTALGPQIGGIFSSISTSLTSV
jgi:pilus assembly protein Flp/PilA